VQEIFDQNNTKMLQGAIIWTPMLLADNLDAVKGKETEFSDPRITQYCLIHIA
jgi:hypothetical protein